MNEQACTYRRLKDCLFTRPINPAAPFPPIKPKNWGVVKNSGAYIDLEKKNTI